MAVNQNSRGEGQILTVDIVDIVAAAADGLNLDVAVPDGGANMIVSADFVDVVSDGIDAQIKLRPFILNHGGSLPTNLGLGAGELGHTTNASTKAASYDIVSGSAATLNYRLLLNMWFFARMGVPGRGAARINVRMDEGADDWTSGTLNIVIDAMKFGAYSAI